MLPGAFASVPMKSGETSPFPSPDPPRSRRLFLPQTVRASFIPTVPQGGATALPQTCASILPVPAWNLIVAFHGMVNERYVPNESPSPPCGLCVRARPAGPLDSYAPIPAEACPSTHGARRTASRTVPADYLAAALTAPGGLVRSYAAWEPTGSADVRRHGGRRTGTSPRRLRGNAGDADALPAPFARTRAS